MTSTGALDKSPLPSPALGDVLEQLTATYREKLEQHGPLMGFAAPPPVGEREFEMAQARKGLEIGVASDPAGKAAALLDREADRHQQIGRLAYYVAGYELSHGDRENVAPLRQLGDDHLGVAEGIRAQRDLELARQPGGLATDYVTDAARQQQEAANANERQFATGRER